MDRRDKNGRPYLRDGRFAFDAGHALLINGIAAIRSRAISMQTFGMAKASASENPGFCSFISRSGSSLENIVAMTPLSQTRQRFDGPSVGRLRSGQIDRSATGEVTP